jgi:hypothetical protein
MGRLGFPPPCRPAHFFGGSDLKLYTVTYDAKLVEGLIALEAAFWHCVTTRTPPPELTHSVAELFLGRESEGA